MTRDMIHAIEIHAEPTTVFDTIATSAGLASFWTADVTGDGTPGGELTFGFPGAPVRLPMRVVRADSPATIEWTCTGGFPFWVDTSVAWSLAASDHGVSLVFHHSGFPDQMPDFDFGSVNLTWAIVVARLKEVVETGGAPNPALS